jgi:hypothetical protein
MDPATKTVRTDRWRYTRWSDGTAELYDETQDREETQNLAADTRHAVTIRGLQKLLDEVGPFSAASSDNARRPKPKPAAPPQPAK